MNFIKLTRVGSTLDPQKAKPAWINMENIVSIQKSEGFDYTTLEVVNGSYIHVIESVVEVLDMIFNRE